LYETFFGFTEKPFNLTPDPKYLYLSARHTEAFAHLEFGRRERGGFVVITGEVGTGKTTLARYFLGRLGDHAASAVVLYPALTAAELLRSILEDLHVQMTGESLKDLVDALHRFLLESRAGGRNVVLLIDEAQDLSPEVLEQIRLISNLETDTEKLIQIVLMGQSELGEILDRRNLRQLAQRVTARYHLTPLNRGETVEYVGHRLRVAGGEGKVTFTSGALNAAHRLSGGVPRVINLLCDRALLSGYVQGTRTITASAILQGARELEAQGRRRPWRGRLVALAAALASIAILALAWVDLRRSGPTPELPREVLAAAALPTPSPLATPAPASTPDPHATAALESLLLTLDREDSLRGASSLVRGLWHAEDLRQTTLRVHLDQVRRFDLPVILEMFHPARRDTCYVALLSLDGDTAEISGGKGEPMPTSVEDLDRFWTRDAVFVWRDFEGVMGSDPARGRAWAAEALSRLGYAEADPGEAVKRFQRDLNLLPDGILGSRTLIALYSGGNWPRPRLGREP
jgi:general secretion pathway protein A